MYSCITNYFAELKLIVYLI